MSLQSGCKLWAIVDLIHSIGFSILVFCLVFGGDILYVRHLIGSIVLAIALSSFLFFGAHASSRCMIIVWQVFAMLQIIGFFSAAVGLFMVHIKHIYLLCVIACDFVA